MRHRIGQLTIRGLDPRLQEEILRKAREERISLNKAALRLLEKRANLPSLSQTVGDSLDHLMGAWTEKEAGRFLSGIRSCEQIDCCRAA